MASNTIKGLHVYQWGVEGIQAQGTLTVDTQPTAADTMTIGGTVYTFVASGADAAGEINRGADLAAAQTNIIAAINGTDGYNVPNQDVFAGASFSSDDLILTAREVGTGGNSIVTTETFTAGTNVFDAGTLGTTTAGSGAAGTAVAATSKIAIENMEWGDEDENMYRPSIANGLLMRNTTTGTPVQHGTRFSFSDQPVVWEQLPHWLTMALGGNVTPVSLGGGLYRWTFTRSPLANPAFRTWTLQRRFSNGFGDNVDQRMAYAGMDKLSLKYAMNEHARLSGSGFARKYSTSTITAGLSLPTAVLGVSALSAVYLNDTWATVGNTQVTEQVIGWELEHGTGNMPLHTADGRTDLDFTKHQVNADEVTLSIKLTLLLDPTTYAAELAKAEAGALRALRIRLTAGGSRVFYVDALCQHTKPSLFKIGEQDGQDIVEIELEEASDGTNFLRAVVETTAATLA